LNQAKEKASEMSESAKSKLNEATDAAKSKIHEAAASSRSSSQSGESIHHPHEHHHSSHLHQHETHENLVDDHRQSPAAQGPYDEPNTPPHAHTYEHTLRGAAEYLKDKVGEGLHSLGKGHANAMPQQEQLR